MPTIRRIGILVTLASLFLSPLWAEAESPTLQQPFHDKYALSLNPFFGFIYGRSDEILYKYPNKKDHVSLLTWDLKPLIYTGLVLNFGPKDPFRGSGTIAAASIKYGLPLETGTIEDFDWQYPDNENLTNYSIHNAYSHNAILADISAGYSWRLTDKIALGACGEISYMYFSWSAENGYFQYLKSYPYTGEIIPGQTWTENIPKIYYTGYVMRYTQNWFIASPAVFLKWKLSRFFSLGGDIGYSPLVFIIARDDHLLVGKLFRDYCFFSHYINGGARLAFMPLKALELSLSFHYRYIKEMRGLSYYLGTGVNATNELYLNGYDGGAGYSAMDMNLSVKVNIF